MVVIIVTVFLISEILVATGKKRIIGIFRVIGTTVVTIAALEVVEEDQVAVAIAISILALLPSVLHNNDGKAEYGQQLSRLHTQR